MFKRFLNRFMGVAALAIVTSAATPAAFALHVQDVTRLGGDIPNELVGMGMVFGLKGTGDGGDFSPTAQQLQALLNNFNDPVQVASELKAANNVAIVALSVEVPPQGARAGERLDVKVSAVAAKSLQGGRLFMVPMVNYAKDPGSQFVFASASGALELDDEKNPNGATIKRGAVLVRDIRQNNVKNNQFTLVLRPSLASFALASTISDVINDDVRPQTGGRAVAGALDETSVIVNIPDAEAGNPGAYIARIQALSVPSLPGPAKVLMNVKTGTIVFTGDVELSPTMISHKGLTITVSAPGAASDPPGTTENFIALDPQKQGGSKLKDLVDAFNLLKVPADDRITIVKQLVDVGALKCDLTFE
jgi:flagellar P-ring protein precursor FlgI